MVLTRETSAGYMTNWAARLFARELERQLAPSGIASAYMPVMFALADGSALTQKELARRAAVVAARLQPALVRVADRLAQAGGVLADPHR